MAGICQKKPKMCWCNARFKKESILTPNSEVFAVFVNLKIILSQLYPEILTICSWKVFTHNSKWDVFRGKKADNVLEYLIEIHWKYSMWLWKCGINVEKLQFTFLTNSGIEQILFRISFYLYALTSERPISSFLFHSHKIHFTFHIKNSKWHFSRNLILVFKHFN